MKADQPTAAQLEAHQARKERLARIAAAAVVKAVPVEVVAAAEAAWEDRQWKIPMPVLTAAAASPTAVKPTVEHIIAACAEHFKVARRDLKSACRLHSIVAPRHIAMYLARKIALKSMPEIGRSFGGRDHTTILSAIRRIERKLHIDPDLAFDVAHIELCLEGA